MFTTDKRGGNRSRGYSQSPPTTTTNRPQSIKNQEELEMCSQFVVKSGG